MPERTVSHSSAYRSYLKKLKKKDRAIEATIEAKLRSLAKAKQPPRAILMKVGGRSIHKVRFHIGNKASGRLIVFIDDTRVIAMAVYAKNKTENMTGEELLGLIDWE